MAHDARKGLETIAPEILANVTEVLKLAALALIDAQIRLMMGVRPVTHYAHLSGTHGQDFVNLLQTIEQAERVTVDAQNMLDGFRSGT